MLKTLMLGGAMLLAIPAFAQTGIHTSAPGTNTNTNTVTGQTGLPNSGASTQWGTSSDTTTSPGLNTGARANTGSSMSVGTDTRLSTSTDSSMAATSDPSLATGATVGGWSNGKAYTGVGGPENAGPTLGAAGARGYPRCSRTVRDACTQVGPRRR